MAEPFQGTVAQVNDNGFTLGSGAAWINYSKPEYGYIGPTAVRVGWIIEVTASQSKGGGWFASKIVVLDDSASPQAQVAPATAPPQAAPAGPQPVPAPSPSPVSSAAPVTSPAPPPSPSYDGYREGAAAAQAEKPVLGSLAYKDGISIPKSVALGRAVEAMGYMAAFDDLSKLSQAVLWLAQELYDDFLAVGAELPKPGQPGPDSPDGDPGPGGS